MEQVLGVDIKLADAGAGNKKPDGSWVYPESMDRRGIVEVTSPPATSLLAEWARAKRAGQSQTEGGCIPLRLNELAEVCIEMLAQGWASENYAKLLAQPADERHLSCLRAGTRRAATTSIDCPTPTQTDRLSTSKTLTCRRASRTSGSAAGHGVRMAIYWVPRRSRWPGFKHSRAGPGCGSDRGAAPTIPKSGDRR